MLREAVYLLDAGSEYTDRSEVDIGQSISINSSDEYSIKQKTGINGGRL
ncbi:hypothetical protein GmarT_41300 [Gimesia maris]|uniref:Uncharacterized protein n=1 Tax=Gimesia maris TaxID=122 RepID=A0ABX5YR60_9PLAN|nr:hypothetical protein GmarT_41300 [Gimesia maris]